MAAFGIPPVSRTKGAMRSQTLQTVVEAGEPDGPDRSSLCIRQHRPGGPKSVPSWKVEHVSASLRAVSSPLMGLGPLCLGRHRISSGAFGSADWLVSSAARPHRPVRVSERRARAPWLRRSAHPDMPAREDGCAEQIGLGFAASNADVHVYVRTRLQKASIG